MAIIKEYFADIIEALPSLYAEGKLDYLNEKRKKVIVKYFGLNGEKPLSQTKISKETGFKKTTIRKMIIQSLFGIRSKYKPEK